MLGMTPCLTAAGEWYCTGSLLRWRARSSLGLRELPQPGCFAWRLVIILAGESPVVSQGSKSSDVSSA